MVLTPVDTNRELLYVWNIYRMLYLTWLIVVKVQSSPFVDKLYLAIWIPSGIHLSWWYDSNFDEVGDYLMISVDIIGNISEKEEMVSGDFYKVLIFWFTSQGQTCHNQLDWDSMLFLNKTISLLLFRTFLGEANSLFNIGNSNFHRFKKKY